MIRKAVILGVMAAWAVILWGAAALPAQEKMFTYDYSFKPGSEPDGFRGLKWQTDIATLDPLHTMEVIEIMGPFTYYKKKKEDLHLVTVKLDDIIYEFWNGKFSGVMIKVRGNNQFQILKDYVFARFGPGQRSQVLERLNVQDFYYNGVKTRMYLKFSDIDRTGELSMYSIALLSKQQKLDTLQLRERAREKIEAYEKFKKK
jgi:ArsR family metal-binding transcriptional regulator